MNQRQAFTTGGQTLTNLDSTGVISENYLDLEDGQTAIKQNFVNMWLNINIRSASFTGGTEGMRIELRASAATAGTSPQYLGTIQLNAAEVVAGTKVSIGVCKQLGATMKYLHVWFIAVSTTFTGTIVVDALPSCSPIAGPRGIQQKIT